MSTRPDAGLDLEGIRLAWHGSNYPLPRALNIANTLQVLAAVPTLLAEVERLRALAERGPDVEPVGYLSVAKLERIKASRTCVQTSICPRPNEKVPCVALYSRPVQGVEVERIIDAVASFYDRERSQVAEIVHRAALSRPTSGVEVERQMLKALADAERRLLALARSLPSLDREPIDWEAQSVHDAIKILHEAMAVSDAGAALSEVAGGDGSARVGDSRPTLSASNPSSPSDAALTRPTSQEGGE